MSEQEVFHGVLKALLVFGIIIGVILLVVLITKDHNETVDRRQDICSTVSVYVPDYCR